MNVIKHMEAAFLFSLSVAGVASVLADGIPAAQTWRWPFQTQWPGAHT